ncbi:reverse transcriptase domain-containing protein [Prosthecodimorpha staleyi]|uniref:Reverse transcriptase domain-containing protein n=1 Tax=Prosthecodimorpha staleyi TaxID=2840188 RepID=A0A947D0K2_9HYPH|nr:reverse transcriptase domain-containing protein [Prosthecodimorpha staleyi]MBT9288038.1 hypothetical protein [Prosthecodimorpha staleyi]
MSSSTLERLFSKQSVIEAWKSFYSEARSQQSSGVDGITVQDFEKNKTVYLNRLCADIRDTYRFTALKPAFVSKPNGKWRVICIPTVQDRIVQRILCRYLAELPRLRINNEVSFGFIKGRGASAARDRAVKLRNSFPWAYKSDISSFFDNVRRAELTENLSKALRVRSLDLLLADAIGCECKEADSRTARILASCGIKKGIGIRQGMPLSPVLANFVLREFDEEMTRLGFKMVRYADDFIVLCSTEVECRAAHEHATSILSAIGLSLPELGRSESKTSIADPFCPVEFLGLELRRKRSDDYSLVITSTQIEKIRNRINDYSNVDFLLKQKITFFQIIQRVQDMAIGYKSAYACASNFDEIEKFLADAPYAVVRALFRHSFGPDALDKLRVRQREFFGMEPSRNSATPRKAKQKGARGRYPVISGY